MDWKSEQEWIVMRYFREKYPAFPKGKLIKNESPDFQLWISTKRFIGIELTQVHQINSASPAQGFLDRHSAVNQVLNSLRAKEEKIRLYRQEHPYQLWLIIFADYSEQEAMDLIIEEKQNGSMESSFDKVFLFDLDTHQVIQLTK